MLEERASGILLHPTSLPGSYGIGELGSEAYHFVDFLVAAKQKLWQVLPLGPTGYGDSPYASTSSFAGNPLLISIERLIQEGLLSTVEVDQYRPDFGEKAVDFGAIYEWKMPLLRKAAVAFRARVDRNRMNAYHRFCETQAYWLDDYALYMAIKSVFDRRAQEERAPNSVWCVYWDRDIATRTPAAMATWKASLLNDIEIFKTWQYFFFEHWLSLKDYANERGIEIIGDLPIYVALDSADVWAEPTAFRLDDNGQPTFVAGVPPDYFSETGQRWGNPVYNWEQMKRDQFSWWIRRFRGTQNLVDIIRVDHFRGFEAGWSIPSSEPTAVKGEWVKAPGMALFQEIRKQLGDVPIVAEDLGLITPEVEHLRDANQFPGMRVLQFAFDSGPGPKNHFLPHNFIPYSVVYTGTHDNDTTIGWYATRDEKQRTFLTHYLGYSPGQVSWDLIRMAMSSVSAWAIVPMQDVLSLGAEARMNRPSAAYGNWSWRMAPHYYHNQTAERLAELVVLFDRI
jgi:4-alpha-glucanotransferase